MYDPPTPGLTCFVFPPGGRLIRWNYGSLGVLYDKDYGEDDYTEPYMGYTPGEDDLPEKGAWPGEMFRA